MLQSFTICLSVSFAVFLIMFIESRLFDKDYHKTDYFKIILLCNFFYQKNFFLDLILKLRMIL